MSREIVTKADVEQAESEAWKIRLEHLCGDISKDTEGWWWLACTCGHSFGPFPDADIAGDAYGDHLWHLARGGTGGRDGHGGGSEP